MQLSKVLIGGFVLLMLSKRNQTTQADKAAQLARYDYLHDPTTWGADQWARLYADDLLPTDAQSPWDAYAARSAPIPRRTGFNAAVDIDQKGIMQ